MRAKSPSQKKELSSYIKQIRKPLIMSGLSGLPYNCLSALVPVIQGWCIDQVLGGTYNDVVKAAIILAVVTISYQFFRFFKRYSVRVMANQISANLRYSLMEALFHTKNDELELKGNGEFLNTCVKDVDLLVEAIRKTVTEIWDTWVLMFAYLVALALIDWRLTLLGCIPLPFAILCANAMKKKVVAKNELAVQANGEASVKLKKTLDELTFARMSGCEELNLVALRQAFRKQGDTNGVASFMKNGLSPIYLGIASLSVVVVVGIGSLNVVNQTMSVGSLLSMISLMGTLAQRSTVASKVFNVQQGAIASWHNIYNVFNHEQAGEGKELEGNVFHLKLEHVSYMYPKAHHTAFCDFNLSVEGPSLIGIKGAVGSGKSALARTLCGFYDYIGSYTLNGFEVRELSEACRASLLKYMPHQLSTVNGSLEDVITWKEKDEHRYKDSKVMACLDELADHKEIGENGSQCSSGQQQRIALARVLYSDAQVLILDDPFANVDHKTELRLIETIKKLAEQKIIFVFSHRPLIFDVCDQVILLEGGECDEA